MKLGSDPFFFLFTLNKYFKIQIWREGSHPIRDGDCGLELTKVPVVPQASSSTFSKCPYCPAPDADAAVMRWEDRATGDTPASPSFSDPHSLGEGWRGRRQREPSLPRRQENVPRSSFTESAEQRWRPATLEVALHWMGLDLFLHLHPSPPSCPRRGLLASTLCLHRGDPDPDLRCAEGLGL